MGAKAAKPEPVDDLSKTGRQEDTQLLRVPKDCRCSALKCGPHRCLPSRFQAVVNILLLIFIFFMFNTFTLTAERMVEKGRGAFVVQVDNAIAALNEAHNGMNESIVASYDEWAEWMQASQAEVTNWLSARKNEWWTIMPPESDAGRARLKAEYEREARREVADSISSISEQFNLSK